MINNLSQLVEIAKKYVHYLENKGVLFSSDGFPVLPREAYLDEWPSDVVTYENRGACYIKDKSKTLLCFYCSDVSIYRRFEKVFDDLPEYQKYLGVVSTDISVIRGMEKEWEDLLMLLNQLFMAILAVNGVKVVLNTRSGSEDSLKNFSHIPKGVMCASGTLGCENLTTYTDYSYLQKILFLQPSKLILYGKSDRVAEAQLATMGIDFKRYDDVHRVYRANKNL
jgi:hypothetical protein